jgi:hypothetical protein
VSGSGDIALSIRYAGKSELAVKRKYVFTRVAREYYRIVDNTLDRVMELSKQTAKVVYET